MKAGNIYDTYFNFRAEDILPAKRDVPELEVTPTPVSGLILRAIFGLAPDSPFRDDRVRQAYVLTWERDLFLDLAYNVANFRDGGLPVETVVESGVWSGAWAGWWLDPRSKDFGPNTKFFNQELAEAKKLMNAAGYAGGVDTDMYYVSPQSFSSSWTCSSAWPATAASFGSPTRSSHPPSSTPPSEAIAASSGVEASSRTTSKPIRS